MVKILWKMGESPSLVEIGKFFLIIFTGFNAKNKTNKVFSFKEETK